MKKLIVLASLLVALGLAIVQAQQPYSAPTSLAVPFYVQHARVDGNFFNVPNVISGLGDTRTLLANESGSTILLDRAEGIVVTLPAPAVGLYYDFVVTTSVTSNAYKFSTATQGTDFFRGPLISDDTDTSDALVGFPCNGSTHDNVSMNGTTTGGLVGTHITVRAVSTTVWQVQGVITGSGTVATSCATS